MRRLLSQGQSPQEMFWLWVLLVLRCSMYVRQFSIRTICRLTTFMPGQNLHWALNHKRICRIYNSFIISGPYLILPEHERLDALLLSHTVARFSLLATPYAPQADSSSEVLMSLLPHPTGNPSTAAVMPIKPPPPNDLVDKLYPRFGNNNFVIHSHLTGVGHGVFPFTSRLFNHSCMPNAVAKYRFLQGQFVIMEIVALRDIHSDEEVIDFAFGQCRSTDGV